MELVIFRNQCYFIDNTWTPERSWQVCCWVELIIVGCLWPNLKLKEELHHLTVIPVSRKCILHLQKFIKDKGDWALLFHFHLLSSYMSNFISLISFHIMGVYPCLKIQVQVNNNLSLWLKTAGKFSFYEHQGSYYLGTKLWDLRQETILEISNSEREITGRNNNVIKLFCTPGNGLLRYSHGVVCCTWSSMNHGQVLAACIKLLTKAPSSNFCLFSITTLTSLQSVG